MHIRSGATWGFLGITATIIAVGLFVYQAGTGLRSVPLDATLSGKVITHDQVGTPSIDSVSHAIERGKYTSTTTPKAFPSPIAKSTETVNAAQAVTKETHTPIIASSTRIVNLTEDSALPLRVGALNQSDILVLTNAERAKAGLPLLEWSSTLSRIADVKARDMIQLQYFEHVSPSGVDIKQLAETYGYDYMTIGENLALGDFEDSKNVLDGWMNSPGHRANILNVKYTELGVAAVQGEYEGARAWFAVQEFGRPISSCPKPDSVLKSKIEIFGTQIDALEVTLRNLDLELADRSMDALLHNQKVTDYNTIAALYNKLVAETKGDVAAFNQQVHQYNACVDAVQ